jgi:mono/diheme cytochrome c family protein
MSRVLRLAAIHAAGLLAAVAVAGAANAQSAGGSKGQQVYDAWCQPCHNPAGPGTHMLAKRLGADHSLIDKRDDLTADYIRYVVRNGLNGMLAFRKTEVTDGELDAVIDYLTHAGVKSGGAG